MLIQLVSQFKSNYPDVKIIEGISDNDHIQVYLNDAVIHGDLSLDDDDDICAMYCLGDLTVEGDILNFIGEGGKGLFVAGKTKANNIIAGGAVIYLNHVSVNKFCLAHYNDGILDINTFSQGIIISDEHTTSIKVINQQAIAFLDYDHPGKEHGNVHLIQDFCDLFQHESWIEADDDDEFYCYFSVSEFLDLLEEKQLNIKSFLQAITLYQQQYNELKNKFKDIDITTPIAIKSIINTMVSDMRSSGYAFGELLYDLDIQKDDSIKIFHGDTKIEGDFCIDQEQWETATLLLIDGNFSVNGTIYNSYQKTAINILVIGDIQCQNMILSNNHFFVRGVLQIAECLFVYNETEEDIPELWVSNGISCDFAIVETNVEIDARFAKANLVYSNSDIYKSRSPINMVAQILHKDYFEHQKGDLLLRHKPLLDAIVNKISFYDIDEKEKIIKKKADRVARKANRD